MAAPQYKQKCIRCRKNYVIVTWRSKNRICYECQKKEMEGEIKDPKMKKLFDLPEEYYMEIPFLRNIKINYLKYGSLTERQVEAFGQAVKRHKEKKEKSG